MANIGRRGWARSRTALMLAAAAATWSASATAQMQMPGSFAVNERGAATYTIPIKVPPGVAGVEPKLALIYNSQRGNGLLGIGWTLSGLSAITRCPQTPAQDPVQVAGAVKFDTTDRFCLDGQRLLVVSGTYGAASSEYRTELESFSKITAVGAAGGIAANGPEQFVVKTRTGLTMTYGGTVDSRLEAQGKTAMAVWSLNKVGDIKGNTYTVTYTEDSANGMSYPSRIDYTGNPGAGLAPSNVVSFDYETRTDSVVGYHMGSASKSTQRLAKIRTAISAGNTAVLEYRLTYLASASTGASRVDSVTQCSAAGLCLPSTKFVWSADSLGEWGSANNSAPSWANADGVKQFAGDFNGDGRTDFAFTHAGWQNTPILFANGDGTWTATSLTTPLLKGVATTNWINEATAVVLVGDFNADGKDDLAVRYPGSPVVPIFFSNGDGSFSVTDGLAPAWDASLKPATVLAGDFNGDGKTDLVFRRADWSTTPMLFSNGDGTWTATNMTTASGTSGLINNDGTTVLTGDFNGDGKSDLALKNPNWTSTPVFFSQGDGTWVVTTGATPSWASDRDAQMFAGDFNGDGKTDLLLRRAAGGWTTIPMLFAKGDGTWVATNLTPPSSAGTWINGPSNVVIADFNGDGKQDVAMSKGGWSTTPILFSVGDGTWKVINPAGAAFANVSEMVAGDFNGDGIADLSYRLNGWATRPIQFRPSSNGQLVSQITEGLGSGTVITTKALPQLASAYNRSYVATAPRVVITPPLPVVTESRQQGVAGESRTTRYTYDSAVAEMGTGRGFLGFAQVGAKDQEFGTWTETQYRLDWPYTGLQKARYVTKTYASSLINLSDSQTEYTCQNPAGAPASVAPGAGAAALTPGQAGNCVVTPGARYQVWASRSTERHNDLGATPLPGTRTEVSDVDKYGNAARVKVDALNGDGSASGHVKQTDIWYVNDETNWILGRPLRSSVKAVTP